MATDRVEIVEIGLDGDFKDKLAKAAQISEDVQIKIKGQLSGMTVQKKSASKKAQRIRKWEGKMDAVFRVLKEAYDEDPAKLVSKDAIIAAAGCEPGELSPLVQKIKRYLRTTKEDKWTMLKKQSKGVAHYYLVPFA